MSSYTCITCRVAFASTEIQRSHYKSDWHRYNLKRKVAEMPPVTSDDFRQRVLTQQAQLAQSTQSVKSYCQVCNKNFNTENAFTNHIQSKKHKEHEAKVKKELDKQKEKGIEKGLEEEKNEKNQMSELESTSNKASNVNRIDGGVRQKNSKTTDDDDDDMEVEEVSDDEWTDYEADAVPVTDCLFCSKSSKTIEDNTHHMTIHHSFFIPHIEYLVDLEGLLIYLGEKVGCGFVCLWCNKRGRSFHALDAVQRHMRDKGHCKLQYEGDAAFEFSDFYDYRSSYPDYNHDGEKQYDVQMKEKEEEEILEEVVQSTADGYQLILPSGAKIGHRELFRYYKQNVPPTREVAVKNSASISRLNMQYKALGWHGSGGHIGEARLADLRFMQKFRAKPNLTMGMKNNKLKQKHYRPQVVF